MKKLLALLLVLAMLLTLVACGGTTSEPSSSASESESESESQEESSEEESSEEESAVPAGRFDAIQKTEEPVSLLLYWHNLQPTLNEEPTEEAPTVKNACRYITADWITQFPNVTIDWCRNLEMTEEWVTVNYTAGTGPDTLFYWGGDTWVERGMALVLDDILASQNYYEPGSPVWKDMFPEYLFDGREGTKMAINDAGQITAIPQVMDPGSATAYYYNADLAEELGLSDVVAARTWSQVKSNILTAREAGYTGTVMYSNGMGFSSGGSWDAQFSLNAAYFAPMIADMDVDGDGIATFGEAYKKQYDEGYYYMANNPAIQEYWEEYLWKATIGCEDGFLDIDYSQAWADGKVLYIEEGLWSMPVYASNTELTFKVGMFPPPYQAAADSEFVADIPYTEAGPYMPTISVALNIMDPELQDRPDYILDYVVDWMKCVTTNDNLSIQVEEAQGVLGATKGCKVPTAFTDWFALQFPIAPTGYQIIRPSITDLTSTPFTALVEQYAFGQIDHDQWVAEYDNLLYQAMGQYPLDNEENLTLWEEDYGWAADAWDAPIAPPAAQ